MNRAFWQNKRVFMTGHTGFKGGWLCLWLQHLGARVTGYSLPAPTEPNLFALADIASGMDSITGDIRDADALTQALLAARPEIVIHMAAQPLVRYSYKNPVETYSTNVMGLVHLYEAVRRTPGIAAVVTVTSDKCYENKEWPWPYRENDPLGGYDPYSNSKGCAELVSAAYRNSFFPPTDHATHGVALATVRAGNVIGGGDWGQDRLIPDIMRAILMGKPVMIRNPAAIRPWQHVLEPLSGYLLVAQKLYEEGPAFGEAWNFGPCQQDAKSVQWIVEELTRAWGQGAAWELDGAAQPHEAGCLKLDTAKAASRLLWTPRWDLASTLQRIVDWYRDFQKNTNLRQATLAQIRDYEAEMARADRPARGDSAS